MIKAILYLILSASFCLAAPGQQTGFKTSALPIVIINTPNGEKIPDEPKITADMKIIHNGSGQINNITDPGNIYSGKVGIEIRGRYSASLPQKPYGFETRDNAGNNLNVQILDMPEENDWVLTANYNDKAFLRNYLAFDIFRKMGHYAPRTSILRSRCQWAVSGHLPAGGKNKTG